MIDHIIIDETLTSNIRNCYVGEEAPLNVSRHLPIFIELNISQHVKQTIDAERFSKQHFNWSSSLQKQRYSDEVTQKLEQVTINYDNINAAYDIIVHCLQSASEQNIKKRSYKKYLKPYWSEAVEKLHQRMTNARIIWDQNGRPRSGDIYASYKNKKREFRNELRKAAKTYENNENERIDKLAEMDQKGFWKTIKAKKRKNKNNPDCVNDVTFNGIKYTEPDKILDGWCDYFTKLYAFSNDPEFDISFKNKIEQETTQFLRENETTQFSVKCLSKSVTTTELSNIIKNLPNGKSASKDNLTYEHIKYGGNAIITCLTCLFNSILNQECVPNMFKEGITITLHKGNGKSKSDPNNYRAISLLPVISKIFEKVILTRIEKCNEIQNQINPLQHGFQKCKNSKMVSLIYQEAVNYATERNSTLFTCFLDAQKAFDRTWICGLLYKLYQLGIKGKLLRTFKNMLTGSSSQVLANGYLSKPFEIKQGTRQGSIWSPFFYIVYINDLIHSLAKSKQGFSIDNIPLSAPTQADDIVLISLTKNG